MKKYFLLFTILNLFCVNQAFSQQYQFDISENILVFEDENSNLSFNTPKKNFQIIKSFNNSDDLELMQPVKLKNPTNQNWDFQTSGPKYQSFVNTNSNKKNYVIDVLPPEPKKKNISSVKKNIQKSDVSNSSDTNIKETKKDKVNKENKENSPILSQTDKNIMEAKELLKTAEKLANSVKSEEENISKDLSSGIKNVDDSIKADFSILFTDLQEDFYDKDNPSLSDIINKALKNSDITLKIVSYYVNSDNRNIAFSRLLNTRKVLLDKGVPTSQTMIMVLEDETPSKVKNNTVEIFVIQND